MKSMNLFGIIKSGGRTMDIENWIQMFNSPDNSIAERTCINDRIIRPYYYRKKPVDAALINEIHDFNQFAIEKTGKPVYDEDVPPLKSGFAEVDKYMVNLGRSRWYK